MNERRQGSTSEFSAGHARLKVESCLASFLLFLVSNGHADWNSQSIFPIKLKDVRPEHFILCLFAFSLYSLTHFLVKTRNETARISLKHEAFTETLKGFTALTESFADSKDRIIVLSENFRPANQRTDEDGHPLQQQRVVDRLDDLANRASTEIQQAAKEFSSHQLKIDELRVELRLIRRAIQVQPWTELLDYSVYSVFIPLVFSVLMIAMSANHVFTAFQQIMTG